MGKSKPNKQTEPVDAVDMERIEQLMGPLPEETAGPTGPQLSPLPPTNPAPTATSAPELSANASLEEAAAAANQSLAAMVEGKPNPDQPVEVVDATEGIATDTPDTVEAVNDIVAKESDTVLAAEDQAKDAAIVSSMPAKGFKARIRELWAVPIIRNSFLGVIGLAVVFLALFPTSRYFLLNSFGVRSSANLTIVDSSTKLPLKNVAIAIGNTTVNTDDNGKANISKLKLGNTQLKITKRAFRTIEKNVTLGWGSNPLGQYGLDAAGTRYVFNVKDFLSGKALDKVAALSGDGNAVSDGNGKVILTLDTSGKADQDEVEVTFSQAGFRDEKIKFAASNKTALDVKMVTSQRELFISDRTGKLDVYSVDIDGKNEKLLVGGSGLERRDIQLVPRQNSDDAALASTRENVKNKDGYLLTTLYVVDKTSGSLDKIDQSEAIEIIGWSQAGRLIYIKIAAGTSAGNNKRHRLVSVNPSNPSDVKELAYANYFNDLLIANDKIYYAPSNALKDATPGLFVVNPDGSGQQKLIDKEVYNIFRASFDQLNIDAAGAYYSYTIGAAAGSAKQISSLGTVNRFYQDNTNGKNSLWYDVRDNKGNLSVYDKASKKDSVLISDGGAKLPIMWLSDKIAIYRFSDGRQTADYAISLDGGKPVKITNLIDFRGQGRWHY